MDSLDFSEEEIEEQLAVLGYRNIPKHRLQKFKQGTTLKHASSPNIHMWLIFIIYFQLIHQCLFCSVCSIHISGYFFPTADLDELILHGELRHLASPPQSSSTKPPKPAATQQSPPAFIKEKGFHSYLSVDRCVHIALKNHRN